MYQPHAKKFGRRYLANLRISKTYPIRYAYRAIMNSREQEKSSRKNVEAPAPYAPKMTLLVSWAAIFDTAADVREPIPDIKLRKLLPQLQLRPNETDHTLGPVRKFEPIAAGLLQYVTMFYGATYS